MIVSQGEIREPRFVFGKRRVADVEWGRQSKGPSVLAGGVGCDQWDDGIVRG